MGKRNKIYRQLNAGANLGLVVQSVNWKNNDYKQFSKIDFIKTIVLQPPFFAINKESVVNSDFVEVFKNPIEKLKFDANKWVCLPIKIGEYLAFVYFHIDFMANGITLSNIFELADISECENKQPDLILVFGAEDKSDDVKTNFYHDKTNDIVIGYLNHHEKLDYFTYMKRMLLTIFNIKLLTKNKLPVRGYLANIVLKNGKTSNLLIVGDSESGKHEVISAFEVLASGYISEIKIIFSDIGYLYSEGKNVYSSGTETGIFTKFTELKGSDIFKTVDRGIFINSEGDDDVRVATTMNTFAATNAKYKIDYFLYANNYEEGNEIEPLNSLAEAKDVFLSGKRKASINSREIEEVCFANRYGGKQRPKETEKLLTEYLEKMIKDKNVYVGQIRTGTTIENYNDKGPLLVARKIFDSII
jgi:hypothetical protein